MKSTHLLLLLLTAFLILGCQSTKILNESNANILFSISDIDFSLQGTSEWAFDQNSIIGTGGEGYIVTPSKFDDFVLSLEFFPVGEVNSGIFIRCPEGETTATGCYEINIWDNHTNQEFRTGAIVTHGKPLSQVNSIGKWNDYRIKAKNGRIQVWLNGVKTADLKNDKTSDGHIALQVMNGEMRFRNILIKSL